MPKKMIMEVGVTPRMALRGQRRWLYLQCHSTLNAPHGPTVCLDMLSPAYAAGKPALHGGNEKYSWFNW